MHKSPPVSALFQWGNFCKFFASNQIFKYFLIKMDFIKKYFCRFEDFVSGFWGSEKERTSQPESTQGNSDWSISDFWNPIRQPYIQLYKRSLSPRQKRAVRKIVRRFKRSGVISKAVGTKREIILPSFGIAGDIVNDMANTLINTATVWKYQ